MLKEDQYPALAAELRRRRLVDLPERFNVLNAREQAMVKVDLDYELAEEIAVKALKQMANGVTPDNLYELEAAAWLEQRVSYAMAKEGEPLFHNASPLSLNMEQAERELPPSAFAKLRKVYDEALEMKRAMEKKRSARKAKKRSARKPRR